MVRTMRRQKVKKARIEPITCRAWWCLDGRVELELEARLQRGPRLVGHLSSGKRLMSNGDFLTGKKGFGEKKSFCPKSVPGKICWSDVKHNRPTNLNNKGG
jgi:hypothetical protein